MEKKAYINPTMDIVRLHTSMQMLAGSGEVPVGTPGDASGAEGREADLDDEF